MKMIFAMIALVACWSSAIGQDNAAKEERAKAMVAALNGGDREGYKKFMQDNYTPELIAKKMTSKIVGPDGSESQAKPEDALDSKVNMYDRIHQDLGEGKVSSIKHDGDKLLMEVAGTNGGNLSFTLTFAKESPYLINGFSVQMMMGR